MGNRVTSVGMRRRKQRATALLAFVVVSALLGGMAVVLRTSQGNSRQLIDERFDGRTAQAARFVSTYTEDLLDREARSASRHLGTGDADEDRGQFDLLTEAFGFSAAVLTDAEGGLRAVAPPRPELLGTDMRVKYAHLRAASEGRRAVSDVVPSAATGEPVVAFATPFLTTEGRYVFSGAYPVADTPIAAFLRDMSTVDGYRVYLVDSRGAVAASHPARAPEVRTLVQRDAALGRSVADAAHGPYRGDVDRYFSSASVPNTPWRVVTSVPVAGLYASVRGPSQWVPWLVLGLLALLAYGALFVSLRYVAGRRQLAVLSDTDTLTRLPNRRSMERQLTAFGGRARRHARPWSVLMVDLDHFKQVNDTYGHPAGDCVLEVMAGRLQAALRLGDEVGRWGGEEFLVVLDSADETDAVRVAERLRAACATPIEVPDIGPVAVTLSVGCATTTTAPADELVAAADVALYRAKSDGRDRVESAPTLQSV